MEDTPYHFESENINLVDSKVNIGDCTPFVNDREGSDPDESIPKTLISENEFQDHVNFNAITSTRELDTRTNEIEKELNVIINSSTALNQNLSYANKESEKHSDGACEITENNIFRESQSLSEVESKPDAPFRGGVQLVRLQAVTEPEQLTKVRNDEETSSSNANSITSAVPQGQIFDNKIQEIADNHPVDYSEADYQFLTPRVPSVPQQVFASPNSEESFGFDGTNFMTLRQPESISKANTPISSCASYVINRLESHSSPVIKTPMLITNSRNTNNNPNDDSTRLNTSSSFQYMHELSDGMSSDFQSCTSTSVSETPNPQQMQRFYTADNQVVYGYKDSQGEFHFFCPALSNRESHNEKERKRRSRVSEACCTLRNMVPGLSDKTDKATVFEQAAAYLKFLREKFASQFDQSYCEKYFQERN